MPLPEREFRKRLRKALKEFEHVLTHWDEYPDRFVITSDGRVITDTSDTQSSASYNVSLKSGEGNARRAGGGAK